MGEPHGIALDARENTVTVYSAEPSMSPRKCGSWFIAAETAAEVLLKWIQLEF
jgi:hypothetical protein